MIHTKEVGKITGMIGEVGEKEEVIKLIFHIIEEIEWEIAKAKGTYTPASLGSDGFIHCSTIDQVIGVANFLYKGRMDLLLLCIDPNHAISEIIYEDLYESGKLFPHIYGSLNVTAITKVLPFEPNS